MSASRRALISVSDKHGLAELAARLAGMGFEIVSTGGTARAIRDAGIDVTDVSAVTGFPEIMDGRVKTLHPAIHGGLLARSETDTDVAAEHGIRFIDLLIVNLYPFEAVTADPGCTFDAAIENIDIGGPAMLRAAAKNHGRLTVVVDTGDYGEVVEAFAGGGPTEALRKRLALKAFAHTARYDAAIASFLAARSGEAQACPDTLVLAARKLADLRYGENPHQAAALYAAGARIPGTVAGASQLQGKALSYNNIADADAALQCVKAFADPACVIVKHMNPCGAAIAASPVQAYRRAHEGDPTSAFGGIIAFNRRLDADAASTIVEQQFAEVVVAPGIDEDALDALGSRKNIRVLDVAGATGAERVLEIKSIEGGFLAQERDLGRYEDAQPRTVTRRAPEDAELADLEFAWTVAKYVKSNAIVCAKDLRTVGIGAGQMSRIVSARIAAWKAEEAGLAVEGAVMASDAFFPFRDGIDAAAERGIRAIVQPGGAQRDEEIIAAADEHGIAMVFTGMRHFRH